MHPDQLHVSVETVRRLVDNQFPRWRTLPITEVASAGTVNALFRIGDDLVARFPLQPGDLDGVRTWLRAEADAARELLGHTRFATPVPVAIGEPGAGYPLPWSVQTWLAGTVLTDVDDVADSAELAADLAAFIRDVRTIDTAGRTFSERGRGGDLRSHDEWLRTCFERSADLLPVPRLEGTWAELRDLPRTAPDLMTHGDLTPGNLLVQDGRLVGVLDVGTLAPADPAVDLVCAWHVFEPTARDVLRRALQCDDLEWERGKAWAFQQAMGLVWYYLDSNPTMSEMGRRTLGRILAADRRRG
jgi:aminoglycoside phosphotransferase (APT) family kinase protein